MKPINVQQNGPESQIKGLKIQTNEQATEVFGVETFENVSSTSDKNQKNTDIPSVGVYNIFWRRVGAEHVNKCSIALPGISKITGKLLKFLKVFLSIIFIFYF